MSVNLSPQICESKVKPIYSIPLLRNLGGEKFIVFASSVANSPSQDVEGISGKGAHASACLLGCNDQWDGCRKGWEMSLIMISLHTSRQIFIVLAGQQELARMGIASLCCIRMRSAAILIPFHS
ncbi:hypothetical protein CUMW_009500 [Citrus unshiu]|nr:hypothetical protein CUMW_009500 [Citrus unshiu]